MPCSACEERRRKLRAMREAVRAAGVTVVREVVHTSLAAARAAWQAKQQKVTENK